MLERTVPTILVCLEIVHTPQIAMFTVKLVTNHQIWTFSYVQSSHYVYTILYNSIHIIATWMAGTCCGNSGWSFSWILIASGSACHLLPFGYGSDHSIWSFWAWFMAFGLSHYTGWWFGTCFSPYIGNNNPNWLSYFSEGLKRPTSNYVQHIFCLVFYLLRLNPVYINTK